MKKLVYFVWLMCGFLMMQACSDDESDPVVTPAQTGTMTDKDGNTYPWVRLGNLDWMAENLKSGVPFYEQTTVNMLGRTVSLVTETTEEAVRQYEKDFGNYYTYQQALDNCPDGWRLPTDEDWKNLEQALGMSVKNSDADGWRNGAASLMEQTAEQGTGLNLRLGGEFCKWGYDGNSTTDSVVKPYRQYECGLYWTSTRDTTKEERVWYRKIMSGRNQVERRKMATFAHLLSVRYVRDAK